MSSGFHEILLEMQNRIKSSGVDTGAVGWVGDDCSSDKIFRKVAWRLFRNLVNYKLKMTRNYQSKTEKCPHCFSNTITVPIMLKPGYATD